MLFVVGLDRRVLRPFQRACRAGHKLASSTRHRVRPSSRSLWQGARLCPATNEVPKAKSLLTFFPLPFAFQQCTRETSKFHLVSAHHSDACLANVVQPRVSASMSPGVTLKVLRHSSIDRRVKEPPFEFAVPSIPSDGFPKH